MRRKMIVTVWQCILVVYWMGDGGLKLLWMINCRETLFLHLFLVKTLAYVPVLLYASKRTFLVVCHGGTMKSEEFLLSQTLPSCSNHPSSPDQPRAGNPSRSVVLSTDTQPPSSIPNSSPLLLLHNFLMGIIMCFVRLVEKMSFVFFETLHCSFSRYPMLNWIYSATLTFYLFLLP